MSFPFLIGPRVQLCPIEETDAETFAKWINDPEMRDYLAVRFPMSLQGEKDWIAGLAAKGLPRNIVFAIERRKDSKHIGSVGLHQIDWVHRRATTGSLICPAAMRRKGYATEAKNLLLDYAFGELGMHSIWAIAMEENVPSCRALEKQGYQKNGIFRKAHLVKGKRVNAIYYDILLEDWERLRGSAKPKRRSKHTQGG
jgi:ribosomal-protein-alanine N-acetyltransferase